MANFARDWDSNLAKFGALKKWRILPPLGATPVSDHQRRSVRLEFETGRSEAMFYVNGRTQEIETVMFLDLPPVLPGGPTETVSDGARAVVESLSRRDFAAVVARFDAAAKETLPSKKLAAEWDSQTAKLGKMETFTFGFGAPMEQGPAAEPQEYRVLLLSFEHGWLQVRMLFNANSQTVSKFGFLSPQAWWTAKPASNSEATVTALVKAMKDRDFAAATSKFGASLKPKMTQQKLATDLAEFGPLNAWHLEPSGSRDVAEPPAPPMWNDYWRAVLDFPKARVHAFCTVDARTQEITDMSFEVLLR